MVETVRAMGTSKFGSSTRWERSRTSCKADADLKGKYGWAPLNEHEAVVKLLLITGKVDADSKDKDGRTPLSWAAENGHEAVVKLLLNRGKVDVNSKDKRRRTPLSWTAANGHDAVAKLPPLKSTSVIQQHSTHKLTANFGVAAHPTWRDISHTIAQDRVVGYNGASIYLFSQFSDIEVFKLLRKHAIRSTFYLIAKNVQNMRAKYSVTDADLYIFDETGFMMGMITPSMVVTRAERRGGAKTAQPGRWEWAGGLEWLLRYLISNNAQNHEAKRLQLTKRALVICQGSTDVAGPATVDQLIPGAASQSRQPHESRSRENRGSNSPVAADTGAALVAGEFVSDALFRVVLGGVVGPRPAAAIGICVDINDLAHRVKVAGARAQSASSRRREGVAGSGDGGGEGAKRKEEECGGGRKGELHCSVVALLES
ncbi:hypothetical protein V500_01008 [Pseudogymnoascus sp. VKM F-4518 (FW-2643)]|nr:hypothetical protein V500_01008 [Pseudogymnoascus sp. VKM F-4518 (FW-2643)]